ncbi:hypothetical protein AAE478_005003 [Parahypoxylon ruwenzoriense]
MVRRFLVLLEPLDNRRSAPAARAFPTIWVSSVLPDDRAWVKQTCPGLSPIHARSAHASPAIMHILAAVSRHNTGVRPFLEEVHL